MSNLQDGPRQILALTTVRRGVSIGPHGRGKTARFRSPSPLPLGAGRTTTATCEPPADGFEGPPSRRRGRAVRAPRGGEAEGSSDASSRLRRRVATPAVAHRAPP